MQILNRLLQKRFIGVDEFRRELTEILDQLPKKGSDLVITQHGKPKGILVDVGSYLATEELLERIADSDPKLIKEINTAIADVKAGHGIPAEKVWEQLGI